MYNDFVNVNQIGNYLSNVDTYVSVFFKSENSNTFLVAVLNSGLFFDKVTALWEIQEQKSWIKRVWRPTKSDLTMKNSIKARDVVQQKSRSPWLEKSVPPSSWLSEN